MRAFADLFCERYHVAPEKFGRAIFWRCLHRRALPWAPFIFLLNETYFTPDFELIDCVGRLTDGSRLGDEMDDFLSHPWNHGFIRNRLKIRVSCARLRRVVRGVMPHASSGHPFSTPAGVVRHDGAA